jgi:hypothetical protein
MNWHLSHFFPMIYGLLSQHIGVVNLSELFRAKLRPTGLDGRNRRLNCQLSNSTSPMPLRGIAQLHLI